MNAFAAPRNRQRNLLAGFGGSIHAELARLRAWPVVWIVLGIWLALTLTFGYLFTYLAYTSGDASPSTSGQSQSQLLDQLLPASVPDVLIRGMPMFGGALMLVLGALVAGSGYGWGTWKTLFAQGVRRRTSVLASMAALTAFVIATLLLATLLDLGLSLLIANTQSAPTDLPSFGSLAQSLGVGFLVLEMWALLGYVLGTLARGPALSVGLGLVWVLAVENLLRGVAGLLGRVQTLTEFLPGTAAGSLVGSIAGTSAGTPGVLDTIPGDRAAITVAVYLALAIAGSVTLVKRRDIA